MSQGEELESDFKITLVVNFHGSSTWKCTTKIVHSSRILCATVCFNYTCDVSACTLDRTSKCCSSNSEVVKRVSTEWYFWCVWCSLKQSFYKCKSGKINVRVYYKQLLSVIGNTNSCNSNCQSHFDQFPNPKHTTNKESKEKSCSRMYIATSIVWCAVRLIRNM